MKSKLDLFSYLLPECLQTIVTLVFGISTTKHRSSIISLRPFRITTILTIINYY